MIVQILMKDKIGGIRFLKLRPTPGQRTVTIYKIVKYQESSPGDSRRDIAQVPDCLGGPTAGSRRNELGQNF